MTDAEKLLGLVRLYGAAREAVGIGTASDDPERAASGMREAADLYARIQRQITGDPEVIPDGATTWLYLVVSWPVANMLFTLDREKAHELAREAGSVVAMLPVVGDYRQRQDDGGDGPTCGAEAPDGGPTCIRPPNHWQTVPAGQEGHMHWNGRRRWPCPVHPRETE